MMRSGFLSGLVIVGLAVLSVPLAFAISGSDHKFQDREALTDVLTVEEQLALERAEKELARAEEIEAQAKAGLEDSTAAEAMRKKELEDAEQDLQDAIDEMQDPAVIAKLRQDVEDAADALDMAKKDTLEANAKFEAASAATDEREALVMAIEGEIEKTAELVGELSDAQVFAMNRNLNNAIASGLLPLGINSEDLQELLDGDFDKVQINAFVKAFEQRARFARHAVRFEEKAEASGDSRFDDKADQMRAKGERHFDRFRAKADAMGERDVKRAARDAAKEAARNAIAEERRKGARGEAKRNGS